MTGDESEDEMDKESKDEVDKESEDEETEEAREADISERRMMVSCCGKEDKRKRSLKK